MKSWKEFKGELEEATMVGTNTVVGGQNHGPYDASSSDYSEENEPSEFTFDFDAITFVDPGTPNFPTMKVESVEQLDMVLEQVDSDVSFMKLIDIMEDSFLENASDEILAKIANKVREIEV